MILISLSRRCDSKLRRPRHCDVEETERAWLLDGLAGLATRVLKICNEGCDRNSQRYESNDDGSDVPAPVSID